MGVIQNNINASMGAISGALVAGKHLSNQKKIANEAERVNINTEKRDLDAKEKKLNSEIENEMTKNPIVDHAFNPETGESTTEVVTDKEAYLNDKLKDSQQRYAETTGMMDEELKTGGLNAQYSDTYKSMSKDAIMYKKAIESYQNKLDMMRTINEARIDINTRLNKLNGGK